MRLAGRGSGRRRTPGCQLRRQNAPLGRRNGGKPCRKGTLSSIARTLPDAVSRHHARTGGQRKMSGRKAGCNAYDDRFGRVVFEFQSSSGQKAGCNPPGPSPLGSTAVSILIWLEGRMQRPSMNGATLAIAMFQSSSGQKAGCNPPRPRLTRPRSPGFNPHPAFWPDATSLAVKMMRPVASFQSSSGLLAGCNTVAWVSARGQGVFQSSSGQKAGCNRRRAGPEPRQPELVSILIRPSGRMQPSARWPRTASTGTGFNPHPAFWPDATPGS